MRVPFARVRTVSRRGVRFVARFEGWVDHPYNDPTGNATIGYGHLLHSGNVTDADRSRWGTITKEQGLRILAVDLETASACLLRHARPIRNRARFDALASLVFNVGCGAFAESTLRRRLNVNRNADAAAQFLRWDRSGGRELPGLLARRKAEAKLFLRGSYLLARV